VTDFVARIPESYRRDCERCMAAAMGEDVESFQWGPYRWDVAKARKLVAAGQGVLWTFRTDDLVDALVGRAILDEHVDHVPCDEPVLLVAFPVTDHGVKVVKRGLFPIDGSHRIARRRKLGLDTTQGYVLTALDSDACRTDALVNRNLKRPAPTPSPSRRRAARRARTQPS
jgi:hypothetical protein